MKNEILVLAATAGGAVFTSSFGASIGLGPFWQVVLALIGAVVGFRVSVVKRPEKQES